MGIYYVYILANKRNGNIYVGFTDNIIRRTQEHKNKVYNSFTAKHNITKLVYFEKHFTCEAAKNRERQIKKWYRDWKIKLIEKDNPRWKDLSTQFKNIPDSIGLTKKLLKPIKNMGDVNKMDSRLRGNTQLKINEIFYSIQGESTSSGLPCVFIRLTYCNLRCTYCDTEYAFYEGRDLSVDEIISEVEKYECNLVEITGGEPLVQLEVHELMTKLCDMNFNVMIETGGSLPIDRIDKRARIIMDLKCPSSGMTEKNYYDNINFIKQTDEIKFVIGNREDYLWAKEIIPKYDLLQKVTVLMSPVFDKIENLELASWILEDNLNVRFQIQLHKYIWDPQTRGV